MSLVPLFLVTSAAPLPSRAQERCWVIDPDSSSVEFSATHMAVLKVKGVFEDISGRLPGDPFENELSARIEIEVSGIHTNNKLRDRSLLSSEFLDAGSFPRILFEGAASGAATERSGKFQIRGHIEVLGEEWAISFAAAINAEQSSLKIESEFDFNRHDIGLSFDSAMDALIADTVGVAIEIHAINSC